MSFCYCSGGLTGLQTSDFGRHLVIKHLTTDACCRAWVLRGFCGFKPDPSICAEIPLPAESAFQIPFFFPLYEEQVFDSWKFSERTMGDEKEHGAVT